jgi:type I restriction enzyme S subunit
MSVPEQIPLGQLMATKIGSVDPKKYPNETFDLYSIPAFDAGIPDVVKGDQIGSSKQLISSGDVLLSKIVPHIRRTWVVGEDHGRRIIGSGEWIVFRHEKIHPPYLRQFLKSDDFHRSFMSTVAGVGGSLLRARPSSVARIKVRLPVLKEQRKIAAILDQAEALRSKRRQALAKLDTLTQSLFLEMFGDAQASTRKWPLGKLGEVASFENGDRSSAYPSGDDLKDEGVVFLNGKNIVNDAIDLNTTVHITPEKFASLSRGKAKRGDLIITLRGTLGSCCIFDTHIEEAFINAQMMIIRCSKFINPRFLHSFLTLQSSKTEFQRTSSGVAVPQLTSAQLKNFPVILPPIELQAEFASRLDSLTQLKNTVVRSSSSLNHLFASLQQRAFNGEL